ncbi:MAG: hypothetical protein P4M01_09105 [Acidobacteriota bacterium]|nr:hypothetical protein [Acidobacteriota bacterium]
MITAGENQAEHPGAFSMFLRQNEDFPENFSIGLKYHPNDGRSEIILLRCNGKHGMFNKTGVPDHPHFDFHVHRATEVALAAGLRAESRAEKCEEFASLEEALQYFVVAINLEQKDANKHFPKSTQADFGFMQ